MSNLIEIPFGDKANNDAVLLLAAAEELGLASSVVATKTGAFVVPEEVAKKAKLKGETVDDGSPEPDKPVAKKAAAKKTTAKKAAAANKK